MTGVRSWDSLAVPLLSCLALGNHFLSLEMSPCLKRSGRQSCLSQHWKNMNGKINLIFICIVPYSLQSRLPASSSQIPMRKEGTSVECLLCAKNRTGCLFTFISCQLHHSLQMGIVILIYFTLGETEVTLLGSSRANI